METSFQNKLIGILKTDPRFTDQDGELVKAAIIDRAWKTDRDLVKLLLSDTSIKQKFFDEIEGHWVFNVNTFTEYVSDKDFLDNSYTRFRNKIGLNIDGKYLRERGEVSLVWPYKDCVLEGGQTKEEERRKEIFFNEILAQDEIDRLLDPKVLTNWKRYTEDGEQEVTEVKRDEGGVIKENLLIRGNNLLALHCLKHQFMGKVKLIYIDPPYNTGNDSFHYNDAFNHSSWLTFMKNRLEVARRLLSDDGFIFVQCDDFENAYLKILMDEVFGQENYRNSIYWHRTYAGKTVSKNVPWNVDTILLYSKRGATNLKPITSELTQKDIDSFNKDDNDGRGRYATVSLQKTGGPGPETTYDYTDNSGLVWKCPLKGWRMKEEKLKALENDGRLYITDKTIREKYYLKERLEIGKQIDNFWGDIGNMNRSSDVGYDVEGQKPEKLIQRLINLATSPGDTVLDFFIGSGTTASVALKMGRQFIGIEQLDYGQNDFVNRLQNVIRGDSSGISKDVNWHGGGEFVYSELKRYNESFMDKINSASGPDDLVNIWKDISTSSFLNWYINPEEPKDALNDFIEIGKGENGVEKQKSLLCELLNKNQLYVNLSEIDDAKFKVTEQDKELNKQFYEDAYDA